MSDAGTAAGEPDPGDGDLVAAECPEGHLHYPRHRVCPTCGAAPADTVDLSGHTADVVTWTTSTATPPGVREPNTIAVVEFAVDGETVRTIGQVTTDHVSTGATVEPVAVDQLREPGAGIRHPDSQGWGGYRFRPVE